MENACTEIRYDTSNQKTLVTSTTVIKKVYQQKYPYFKPLNEYFDGLFWIYEYPYVPGVTIHTFINQNDFSWVGIYLSFLLNSIVTQTEQYIVLPFDDICNYGNFVINNDQVVAIDLIDSKLCCYKKNEFC